MAARSPFPFDVAPAPASTHLRLVPDRERRARLVLDVRDKLRGIATRIAIDQRADVDELHQMALAIACERAAAYDPNRGAFSTYLFMPVHKALVTYCRNERERRKDLARIAASYVADHEAGDTPEDLVVEAVERERVKRRVAEALAELGEEDRRIVVRHAMEGATLTAVQRELGVAKYWDVWARYGAAVKRLEKRLRASRDGRRT